MHEKHNDSIVLLPPATRSAILELLRPGMVIALIVLVYSGLDFLIINGTRLNETAYQNPFIILELVKRLWSHQALAVLTTTGIVFGGFYYRRIWQSWNTFEHSSLIRPFITLNAALLAWRFGTYEYNFYFDQAHLFDRMLLIGMVPLIWWRPVFIFPFLFLTCAVIWQFAVPLGSYSWAQQYMPIRLLTLFGATLLLNAITGRRLTEQYVFIACCLVVAHYWIPGVGKLMMDWSDQGHVYNMLPATYANGWLGFLNAELISAITRIIARFDPIIVFLTMLLQLGAIVALWRKKLLLALLWIYPFFHLAIFSFSGILFWQWIIIEAALIVLVSRIWRQDSIVFTPTYFIISLLLIGGSSLWFKPVKLAWYDSNLAYTTRFEAEGVSGGSYKLSPDFFAPYQYQFTLGNFAYIADQKHLNTVWGATTNVAIVEALRKAKNIEQVKKIESKLGTNYLDPVKVMHFDRFLRRFTRNLNQRKDRSVLPNWLSSPPQLWTFSRDKPFNSQENIQKINVFLITSLFADGRYAEIDRKFLGKVDIPQ